MPTQKSKERAAKELIRKGREASLIMDQKKRLAADLEQAHATILKLQQELEETRMTTTETQAELARSSEQFNESRVSKDHAIERLVGEVALLKEEVAEVRATLSDTQTGRDNACFEALRLTKELGREKAEGKDAKNARKALVRLKAEHNALLTRYHQVVMKHAPQAARPSLLHFSLAVETAAEPEPRVIEHDVDGSRAVMGAVGLAAAAEARHSFADDISEDGGRGQ